MAMMVVDDDVVLVARGVVEVVVEVVVDVGS